MEVRAGCKNTEVGVIPDSWDVRPFGELATPRKERVDPRKSGVQEFCIELEHIGQASGRRLGCTTAGVEASLKTVFHADDVLFGKLRAYLRKYWLADGEGVCSTEIWALVTNPRSATPSFVYQVVTSDSFIEAASNSYGTHMPRSDWNLVKGHPVAAPPLPEQHAIATALSDVDSLLAAQDKLIAKKRDIKQAAMQQLLTGRQRLPGFSGEWEVKRLSALAKIQRGASPRPIDSPVWFDENSSIGWVRISDVTRSGMFLIETSQRLSQLGVQHSRAVAAGSLIMSICATVGRPIITKIDVCIHDGFVVFDNLEAEQLFVYYVLKWTEPNWSKHGQTGSQMNLNTGLINSTQIQLPPRDEQTAIAAVLYDMDAEIAVLEQQRDKTRSLKQGMMQELLTGRIRLV